MKIYKTASYKKIAKKKKEWDPNPWAVCTESVGREDKDKYERCIQDVKKQQKKQKKEAQDVWTPAMEKELEEEEIAKKRERRRLKDDYISPHIKRPGKGRGISRKKQRRGIEEVVTEKDFNRLFDEVENRELEEKRQKKQKKPKKGPKDDAWQRAVDIVKDKEDS